MTTYQGKCYCGQTGHCNVCKALSGSAYMMNQIIPKANFKLTKGDEALKSFTYYGESGDDKITLRTGLPNKGHEFPVEVAQTFETLPPS
ncbi:hypothetical protein V2W45_1465944 [Cenococcum geophilum]